MAQRDPKKWDDRFMAVARVVRDWSSDPRKRVGAVVVSPDGRQLSAGYNGLPRDFEEKLAGVILPKEEKNKLTLHAESNALSQAPCDVTGWTLYVTTAPCLRCALEVHRSGVARVVVDTSIDPASSWCDDQAEAQAFLQRMGVEQVYLSGAEG